MSAAVNRTQVKEAPMRRPIFWLFTAMTLILASPADAKPRGRQSVSSGAPDISGVWFMHGKLLPSLIPLDSVPFLPAGAERYKASKLEVDPELHCFPSGVPRVLVIPASFEIIPVSGRVLIYYEYQHLLRQIHMNRATHPPDLIPTWMGDSIGKWEGDTLVVDTVGFVDKSRLDIAGLPHSDALHVVERIRRPSRDVLQVDITVDDPKMYSKPLTAQRIFDFKPGWEIGEWVCEENNAYLKFSDEPPGQNAPTK
jgi:hypothetical protein